MSDNVIRMVWNRDGRDGDKHPEGRAGQVLDLRENLQTYYAVGQFLEELVVFRKHRYGHRERYGLFEVRVHQIQGTTQVDQFYFPEKYQIPHLQPGITYLFPVSPGPHPESGELIMCLCHNDPIARLI